MLEETRRMSASKDVHRLIDAALAFTKNYTSNGRNYRTGKPLINYLISAARSAEKAGEIEVAERLEDFSEYAAGEIPLYVLESFYIPGRASDSSNEMTRLLMQIGFVRSIDFLDELLERKPSASARKARAWFKELARKSDMLEVMSGRRGGLNLPKGWLDHMIWLSRIEIGVPEGSLAYAAPRKTIEAILRNADDPDLLIQVIELKRRGEQLEKLRSVVEDPGSLEQDIQEELAGQTWIFGGRYIGELDRRRITLDATVDIPLLRGDGSLHVVELKKANIPNLIERPRAHPIVGAEVHRATAQASHYLRSLDENRNTIYAEFGIDCRRVFATVVIGHPLFINEGYTEREVSDAFRTYNSQLSRIEVLTYQELIESAERALHMSS
jgi:hypothetical protein